MKEVHGVTASIYTTPVRVTVVEEDTTVLLDLGRFTEARLKPDEAIHLASKLHRIARRIISARAATRGPTG